MENENQREERRKKIQSSMPVFRMDDPEKTTLPISFTLTSDAVEEARTEQVLEKMRQLMENAHGGEGPVQFEFGDTDTMSLQQSSLMSYKVEKILKQSRELQEMLKKAAEEREEQFDGYDEQHINPLSIPSTTIPYRRNGKR